MAAHPFGPNDKSSQPNEGEPLDGAEIENALRSPTPPDLTVDELLDEIQLLLKEAKKLP